VVCCQNWAVTAKTYWVAGPDRRQLITILDSSANKLRHSRSVAYSVELVLLNKRQISDVCTVTQSWFCLWPHP